MSSDELKERCKAFGLAVITMFKMFPKASEAQILGKQLLRSAISVAANYRAACRARSREEFLSKLSIVVEEADETVLWLELINDSNTFKVDPSLIEESKQLLYIMSSDRKTTKTNLQRTKISKSINQQISK
ncbi:four helix bundle protein [Chryseolinea sp. T2]|uniref:four helix bundle protein n=1 Tax=Chryseolinea sp. T2 TaxID=3129255 RepID=UPI003077C2BC